MASSHPMLASYKPTEAEPFDATKAAHLLNRAGFGGTPEEIERVVRLGPYDAVDWLLDFPDAPAEELSQEDVPNLSAVEGYPRNFREYRRLIEMQPDMEKRKELQQQFQAANREVVREMTSWWLRRMAYGPFPMQEKLTLFWHGHFTTSAREERSAMLIWEQNECLRHHAALNFRTLTHNISRDPAMLDYLNNTQNRKQRPNENYARELMELFTLGIGHYTEKDIKEAARAFTGWAHEGESFVFRKNDHDFDEKTFFGRRGKWDGSDVIEIILARSRCAEYIGTKIWQYFVTETVDASLANALGDILMENRYEMRPFLRRIFTSRGFYDQATIGNQIKSPVQLVVGTIRLLGLEMPPFGQLYNALQQMGQVPLMPPNVKGWPGGRTWVNTSTLFVRYNTGIWLAGGNVPAAGGRKLAQRMNRLRGEINFVPKGGNNAEAVVDEWVSRLIQRPIDAKARKTLLNVLGNQPQREENVRRMVQLIVSMPEYQLC
jgi:hypothetical protein